MNEFDYYVSVLVETGDLLKEYVDFLNDDDLKVMREFVPIIQRAVLELYRNAYLRTCEDVI